MGVLHFPPALLQERKHLNALMRDLAGRWEELLPLTGHFRREARRFGAVPVGICRVWRGRPVSAEPGGVWRPGREHRSLETPLACDPPCGCLPLQWTAPSPFIWSCQCQAATWNCVCSCSLFGSQPSGPHPSIPSFSSKCTAESF